MNREIQVHDRDPKPCRKCGKVPEPKPFNYNGVPITLLFCCSGNYYNRDTETAINSWDKAQE